MSGSGLCVPRWYSTEALLLYHSSILAVEGAEIMDLTLVLERPTVSIGIQQSRGCRGIWTDQASHTLIYMCYAQSSHPTNEGLISILLIDPLMSHLEERYIDR